MIKLMLPSLLASALACLSPAAAQPAPPAAAPAPLGAPAGWGQEVRTVVTARIPDAVAQSLLPAGWTVNPVAQGPAKGANFAIVFAESLLGLAADGKPEVGPGAFVALSVPARNGEETAFGIVAVLSDARTTPGFYRVGKPATVTVARTTHGDNLARTVEESWSVAAETGERLAFRVAYEAGPPARIQLDSRNVSAADPKLRRLYRIDQGSFVIRSQGSGIDRAKTVSFEASGGMLDRIFEGGPSVVSIAALPWYERQMFVPPLVD
ncbi:hypothetical protein [Methylobacterium sp. ID0610]|uniref:hypothetical protein n=1 Tax=Methylobacterium carpenticola TaxID=3344827 RepID=UPI0036A21CB6